MQPGECPSLSQHRTRHIGAVLPENENRGGTARNRPALRRPGPTSIDESKLYEGQITLDILAVFAFEIGRGLFHCACRGDRIALVQRD